MTDVQTQPAVQRIQCQYPYTVRRINKKDEIVSKTYIRTYWKTVKPKKPPQPRKPWVYVYKAQPGMYKRPLLTMVRKQLSDLDKIYLKSISMLLEDLGYQQRARAEVCQELRQTFAKHIACSPSYLKRKRQPSVNSLD
jgi:hypothetical protein